MGWVIYIDAFERDYFPNAETFFEDIELGVQYASILYIRVPWSQLEPVKNSYAWEIDENYKLIIKKAQEYGLKLAFRIYVDGKNSYQQATPDFVKVDGARGYLINPENGEDNTYWTPCLDDSIFQKHFEDFVEAFAKEYDDATKVDFIDAQGLGWWGEMHNVDYLRQDEKEQVVEDALYCHANTLDLRVVEDVKRWVEECPELVEKFIRLGGYHFKLTQFSVKKCEHGIEINHEWINEGVGRLPNNCRNWDSKYKLVFGIFKEGQLIYLEECKGVEVGEWIKEEVYNYSHILELDDRIRGEFEIGVSIRVKEDLVSNYIHLHTNTEQIEDGWYGIGRIIN